MESENIIIIALIILILIVGGVAMYVTNAGIHLNKDDQLNITNTTNVKKNITANSTASTTSSDSSDSSSTAQTRDVGMTNPNTAQSDTSEEYYESSEEVIDSSTDSGEYTPQAGQSSDTYDPSDFD